MSGYRLKGILLLALGLLITGCASQGEVTEDPGGTDFQDRIQEQSRDGITVRAGVPSAKESEAVRGRDRRDPHLRIRRWIQKHPAERGFESATHGARAGSRSGSDRR